MNTIVTKSTSSETMDVSPIILRETKTTRLIFKPTWVSSSENPLRGGFRFQRKGVGDSWEDVDAKSMQNLKKDEEYRLSLKPEEILCLLNELENVKTVLEKHGHTYGERSLLLSEENVEGVFLQITNESNRDWIIGELKKMESSNFDSLGDALGRAKLEKIISTMEENLENDDESFWQGFFQDNSWILQQLFAQPVVWLSGETYLGGKNASGRQGRGGVATDSLLRNGSNGSFAVVEIKTPKTDLVGSQYRGNGEGDETNEVFQMDAGLTGAFVQMENQIATAREHFGSVLGQSHKDLGRLHPKGILIVGNYSLIDTAKQKSFDLFRNALGGNIILTFDEVLKKVQSLHQLYVDPVPEVVNSESLVRPEDIPF